MKTTKKNLKANLEEHLNLLESNQFPTEKLFNLSQMKSELETKLKDLENQNFSKTKTIGDIETRELKSNKTKIISLGFILGLITSFLMVFVNTFVEHYRNRKA